MYKGDKEWLICINECKSFHGVLYKKFVTYYYEPDSFYEGIKNPYYAIFDNKHNIISYQDMEFIMNNFIKYSLYLSEEKYIEDMFNFFMDNGIKLKDVKLLN